MATLKVDYKTVDYAELDTDYLFDEIRGQFAPEQVFSEEELSRWAINNDWVKFEKEEKK